MKKEILVGLLPVGFIFAGVVSAGAAAVTWTIVEDASFAMQSPGADGLLGTGDDGFTWCNMDPAGDCETVGYPTKGSLSYAELAFKMASSCPGTGQSCTSNTDCIDTLCVPCSPNPGLIYLGLNPGGGDKGLGTYTVDACENGFDVTKVAIGTTEVVPPFGGGCMVLDTFNSSTGCGVGTSSTNYDLTLWTSTVGDCGAQTGIMPGLALSGRIMAATGTTTACGYTAGELSSIASAAGLGEGDYLSVMCGNGTLPTDLKSACIAGADWQAIIVASTSAGIAGACAGACGGVGCLAGTAEGVE